MKKNVSDNKKIYNWLEKKFWTEALTFFKLDFTFFQIKILKCYQRRENEND
jgi:hypothetical protein